MLRIRDVYPGSRILIFTHPRSRIQKQEQKRGVKKNFCHTFIGSHKFHKFVSCFSFEVLKKKIWANFQRIIELCTQKIVSKFSKIWGWDPGSEKNLFRIPDPGVKKAPNPGSGSATLYFFMYESVLQIRDISVRIRIESGSADPYHIPLTYGFGSGSGSCFFVTDWQEAKIKYFAFYFLKVHLHQFSLFIDKKSRFLLLFLVFCLLMEGSGSIQNNDGSGSISLVKF